MAPHSSQASHAASSPPLDLEDGVHEVSFTFSSAAPDQEEWKIASLSLTEYLSRTYVIDVDLCAEHPAPDAFAMLGKSATVRWERGGNEQCVHGIVMLVEDGPTTRELMRVRVRIEPALCALRYVSSSRIFADHMLVDVVQDVLNRAPKPFGLEVVLKPESARYPKREYIVQHRETDLDFISRLLAEQGFWYFFEHPADGKSERLIITDTPHCAPRVADDPEVLVQAESNALLRREAISEFGACAQLRPTALHARQFDWTHPELSLDKQEEAKEEAGVTFTLHEHGDFATYDYRETHYRECETAPQARIRLASLRSNRHVFEGRSGVVHLRPGHFVKIEGVEYIIITVSHEGDSGLDAELGPKRGTYSNRFRCVRRDGSYRPPRLPKPFVSGPQTAIVVDDSGNLKTPHTSSDGKDIATDVHGRVRVKFPWDLTPAAAGGTNSCHLRVAQAWAGSGWGAQFTPRVGMEVMVQFLDGDPDQPVITGCLYNGLNRPPYADMPTQSGFKTASSVDSNRYNELRFEDANDREQIFVRAQKDLVKEVLHDESNQVHANQTESIGADATLTVGGKRSKTVRGDESVTVNGTRSSTVDKKNTELFKDEHERTVLKGVRETFEDTHDRTVTGKQTLEAQADKLEHVAGTYELTTDKAYLLKQGGTQLSYQGEKVALDAAGAISVKRGTASLEIDAAGNMEAKTTGTITFAVGANKLVISASGIELNGMQIAATAGASQLSLTPAAATLSAPNTTVEASAICVVKGMPIAIN